MPSNLTLIIKGISHLRYKRLNRDLTGFIKEADLDPIPLGDVRLYASATNDDPSRYSEDSIIPPLFVSRLIHPFLMDIILDPRLKMNILKMVHGELEIKWFAPVYVNDRLRLKMEVKEIIDTKAGELIRLSFMILKDNSEVAEAIAGLLSRNPQEREKNRAEDEEKREIICTREIKTDPDQALRYAVASRDNNLIHTSTLFAKIAGLKRPILHGVCGFAITCNELIKEFCNNDITRIVSMKGRFAYPIYPGDTLTLNCYRTEGDKVIDFEVTNREGKKNIRLGRFEFR
jgi:3-hydroxyacyl-CoA dehydrogenase/3a,7a,12a-trihydroxy-5b-cholest-24-enoyl-CoA hydratase